MAISNDNRTAPAFKARKALSCLVTLLLVSFLAAPALNPRTAEAETTPIIAEPDELQKQIEQSSDDYNKAVADLESIEQQIEETRTRIDELNAGLPEQEEKSSGAMKALYGLQNKGVSLVDMLLGVSTIDDFLTTYEYIDRIHTKNVNEVNRLTTLKNELAETEKDLEEKRQQAETQKIRAEDALKSAQAAREEAQKKAAEAAAAEQKAAEEAAKAAEAEKQEAAEGAQDQTDSTGSGTQEPDAPSGSIDWSVDKQAFVNEWAPRIDAYLSGSPTAGQGTAYAEAAWDYGVDPRWSPAISNTESTKGAHCIAPHNAWGWGTISWASWEESINAHVRGLARGYGYTISIEAAKKYCPPNWEHWYNATLAQMEMI